MQELQTCSYQNKTLYSWSMQGGLSQTKDSLVALSGMNYINNIYRSIESNRAAN